MIITKSPHQLDLICPADLLEKALIQYYPENSLDLYCEPFSSPGKPHWSFDNFRCGGAVSYEGMPLFYTQPSWGKFIQEKVGVNNCRCVTYAVDPDIHFHDNVDEIYEIGFIGNIQEKTERHIEIEAVKERFNAYISTSTPTRDLSTAYSKCKVGFNQQRFEEINIRFFEMMGIGLAQVVKYSPALSLFAEEGVHYLSYKTIDEAVEKIQWLLDHNEERIKMGKEAQRHVYAHHTYKHRAEEILLMIGEDTHVSANR